MLHPSRRPVLLVVSLCVIALLMLGLMAASSRGTASGSPVADAWQRAKDARSYHFSSDVVQATVPLAQATNVGRSSRVQKVHLEGSTDLRAASLEMQLWANGGSVLQEGSAAALRVENGKVYLRQGEGAWQEAPGSDVGRIAPQGDFMAYLHAVRDVAAHPPETRAGIRFTRYTFALDGPAFAEYIRSQFEQAMRSTGTLPAGASAEAPRLYRDMNGTGELWVGADGMPLRQILNLSFPAQQDSFQSAQITVNFSQYGRPESSALAGLLADLAASLPDPVATLATLALALVGLAVLRFHRSRRLGRAVSAVAIASLALGSLPQALKANAIATARAAESAAQDKDRADAATARELGERLGATAFDPRADPLAAAERRARAQAIQLGAQAAGGSFRAAPSSASPAADTGLDTDGDGLTDWREQRLGTDPTSADTDGDEVPDRIEAGGFTFRNTTGWFLNPSSTDSNSDGINDGVECWRSRPQSDPKTMPGCDLDTDADGMPDVFDADNDNDGAPDRLDLAPFTAVAGLGEANPLKLTLRNLDAGKPTFVDFQLRPKNAQHLWFAFNVLDWPHDDAGQVRDVDDKAFADIIGANERPAANDALGDMKLVPMLEVRIPNGANLPPQSDLIRYGIGARELGGGVKIAYVPLTVQTDEKTGMRVGFTGRMLYLPDASWPAPNDVRLVWNVQTLLDIPCAPDAPDAAQQGCHDKYIHNLPQVAQSYYDDFALTGMSVQQDHGASAAIVYEDPAADADKRDDSALWSLSYGLNTTFVTGRDADKNGQRDITVNEIARRFDRASNAAVPEEQRWAVPNVLRVEKADYPTLDQATITTAMTETKRILNARFAGDASLKPLLLFATESRSRSLGLDALRNAGGYVATSGGGVTVDWQPAGQPRVSLDVLASMKWSAFCPAGAQSWDACASDVYWNEIEARSPASAILPEDDPADADVALGRVAVTELYFESLHQGITRPVQQDGVLISGIYTLPTDPENASLVRTATKLGPLGVKKIANEAILIAISLKNTNQAFTPKNFVRQLGKVFSAWKNGSAGGAVVSAVNILKDFLSGGHMNRLKAIGVVGTVVALVGGLATLGVYYAGGAFGAAVTVKVVVFALTAYFSVISPILGAREWFSALRAAGRTFDGALGTVLQSSSKILGTTRTASAIGTVLALAATWGFFIYSMVANGVSAFSPEFNKALAETIATTIYVLVSAFIASTVIGTILVGLVAVIDAILTAVCELGVDKLRTVPGLGGACFTLGTSAIKVLAYFLYNYDVMINVGASDLVVTGSPQMRLADPNKGFVASNPLRLSLPITTTIRHKDPDPAAGLMINLYLWQFSPDNLRSSTFRYSLSAPDAAEILPTLGEMRAAWRNVVEDHKYVATPMYRGQASATASLPTGIQLAPGLNRKAEFNLNLGYAVPAYECWPLPHPLVVFGVPPVPVCYTRSHQGTDSTKIDALAYDIYPNTLDEFMALGPKQGGQGLSWDSGFPALRDADGDGLLARGAGGLDFSDAKPDTDNDGLSDAFEVERLTAGVRFAPLLCDSDNDSLTDSQEVLLGTNPAAADTDGDGISDGDEVLHVAYNLSTCRPTSALAGGWRVHIGGVGQTLIPTVSSDPLQSDSDNDGLSDAAERTLALGDAANRADANGYPYHPLVANKAPVGIYLAVDDADRFVRPGQKLLYTTTVARGIPLAPGFLDVLPPTALGAAPAPYPLNFTAQQTITQQTALTVQPGAASQAAQITSRVRAALPNNGGALTVSGNLAVVAAPSP